MDSVLNQIEAADQQIAELNALKANAREKALEEAKKLISYFSIAPSELFEGIGVKKSTRPPVRMKYSNKDTGAEWSGRGKCPKGFERDSDGKFIGNVVEIKYED